MTLAIKQILEALSKKRLDVTINHNRSTMISILERSRKYARISLHHMFLEAPNEVLEAVAHMLNNSRKHPYQALIRKFINQETLKQDKPEPLDLDKLHSKGQYFDLQALYLKMNQVYFKGELNLNITWFGKQDHRPKSQVCFGLYYEPQKLVKIHRLLDRVDTPSYFIEYIVYHEMLHEVFRPKLSKTGRRIVHTPEFKKNEQLFQELPQAKAWEQQFKKKLFNQG